MQLARHKPGSSIRKLANPIMKKKKLFLQSIFLKPDIKPNRNPTANHMPNPSLKLRQKKRIFVFDHFYDSNVDFVAVLSTIVFSRLPQSWV